MKEFLRLPKNDPKHTKQQHVIYRKNAEKPKIVYQQQFILK